MDYNKSQTYFNNYNNTRNNGKVIILPVHAVDLKQKNTHTVLWTLCDRKASTTKELAKLTGLSFATVSSILNALVATGQVLPGHLVTATGGRPSQTYHFHAEYAHVLALSAHVRKSAHVIRACVCNLWGEAVWETELCADTIVLSRFESIIDRCLERYPSICILSFSLPGVEHRGVVVANDYPALVGSAFPAHFQGKYRRLALVENDVNAAVLGYAGNTQSSSPLAGVYFPKCFNPGAGILIGGQVYKGFSGYAGEVALTPLGIDWCALDYTDPREAGAAIGKLLYAVCSIVNPEHVVLYGDFFDSVLQESVQSDLRARMPPSILPQLHYRKELEQDIITGLTAQALTAYRQGLHQSSAES